MVQRVALGEQNQHWNRAAELAGRMRPEYRQSMTVKARTITVLGCLRSLRSPPSTARVDRLANTPNTARLSEVHPPNSLGVSITADWSQDLLTEYLVRNTSWGKY